jgi:hypothetical protein
MKTFRVLSVITIFTVLILINIIVQHKNSQQISDSSIYFIWLSVYDESNNLPIDFNTKWDMELVSETDKGSDAAVKVFKEDKSGIILITGKYVESGIFVEVFSEGYKNKNILIKPQSSGIAYKTEANIVKLSLEKSH